MYTVHFRNSREEKSVSGVGNPCPSRPLSNSLLQALKAFMLELLSVHVVLLPSAGSRFA